MGAVFLWMVALAAPLAATRHWASASIRWAVEDQAPDRRHDVAAPHQLERDPISTRSQLRVTLLVLFGVCFVVGGFLFVFGLVSLADDVPDSREAVVIGGATALPGLALGALSLPLVRGRQPRTPRKSWTDDQIAEVDDIETAAQRQESLPLPRSLTRLRTCRKVLAGLQYGLVTLTAMLAVVGILARQPCRTCEPRSYGPDIELTLDGFWIGVGVVALAAAVVLVAWGVVDAVADASTRRELMRRIDEGRAEESRPETSVLADMVEEGSSPWDAVAHQATMWMMGPLLLGSVWLWVGAVGHTIYLERVLIGWGLLAVGMALLALMVVATVIAEVTGPAVRDRLRQAWPVDGRAKAAAGDI